MATFGCYKGNMHIAENTKEEFTTNVLKLLNYGGMVQFDEISIGGYKIALIKPVELNQYGEACFDYNYFEDNFHETARYNAERAHLFTAAIGCDDFCYVITAVHFLYGLYDNSYGCVEINDDIVNGHIYIGWINHILGTNYSLKKFFQLWEQFESFCLYELNEFEEHGREEYRDERYRDVPHWFDEAGLVPNSLYWALGSTHFADIYYIKEGTSSFREDEIVPGSYPESVYKCKILLKQYFSNDAYAESKKTKRIWQLVKNKRKTRKEIRQYGLQELAQISLRLPARVIVYLTCEIIGQPFWSIWKQIREDAYKDEKMPQYPEFYT